MQRYNSLWKTIAPALIIASILWAAEQISNNRLETVKNAALQQQTLVVLQSIDKRLEKKEKKDEEQDKILFDHEGRLIRIETKDK